MIYHLHIVTIWYIALHLAAMDTPRTKVHEIVLLLLLVGCDMSILSGTGETALQIATAKNNTQFIEAYDELNSAQTDKTVKAKLQNIVKLLKSKYSFQTLTKTRGVVMVSEIKQHFEIPEFLLEEQDLAGNIPDGMTIHEHQIKPLTNLGEY